ENAMITCKRCGNELRDNPSICPLCGTPTTRAKPTSEPITSYGTYPPEVYSNQAQEYMEQSGNNLSQRDYIPLQQQYPGYAPMPYAPPMHQPGYVHVAVVNQFAMPARYEKNTTPLSAEIFLSMLGIYGI